MTAPMASSALLQTIRERQGAVADVGAEGGGAPASRVDAVASALLAKMAGFFRGIFANVLNEETSQNVLHVRVIAADAYAVLALAWRQL